MNKKAQGGLVAFIVTMLFFFIFMGLMGGTLWAMIGFAGEQAGLTGIEAFIFDNFAIVVFLSAILGTMGYMYFRGGQ